MAILKTGSIITDISGKVGGQSFQRCRQGLTLQNSPGHTNNSSYLSSHRRSITSRLYHQWRSLTQSQRDAWNSRALIISCTNSLGNHYFNSGFIHYCNINYLIALNGNAIISVPGPLTNPTALQSATYTIVSNTSISISYTPATTLINNRLYVFASYPVSQGISKLINRFKLIFISTSNAYSPQVLTSSYLSAYGRLPLTGEKVFFKAFILLQAIGNKSAILLNSVIVP